MGAGAEAGDMGSGWSRLGVSAVDDESGWFSDCPDWVTVSGFDEVCTILK